MTQVVDNITPTSSYNHSLQKLQGYIFQIFQQTTAD